LAGEENQMKAAARIIQLCTVPALLLLFAHAAHSSVIPAYQITDLGSLVGGYYNYAYSINNAGIVVGITDVQGAVLWSNTGTVVDLHGLWGTPACGSQARAISNNGDVAGTTQSGCGGPGNHQAVLWSGDTLTSLGTLGGEWSDAFGINDLGHVVGISDTGQDLSPSYPWRLLLHAFIWSEGNMTDLGTLGGTYSLARSINDNDQVVGFSQIQPLSEQAKAFLWEAGSMIDLGVFGSATDINNKGQIVGGMDNGHAFFWDMNQLTDLGTIGDLNAYPNAINDNGQVVGSFFDPTDGLNRALFWDQGQLQFLDSLLPDDSGWQLTMAYDINNSGQIVGWGWNPQGQARAFLMSPITIPEPPTIYLLVIAGLGLLVSRNALSKTMKPPA
jgi:probable HAF family extracellular repeat protein